MCMYAATDPQHISIHHSTCRTTCFCGYGFEKKVALTSVWIDDPVFVPSFSGTATEVLAAQKNVTINLTSNPCANGVKRYILPGNNPNIVQVKCVCEVCCKFQWMFPFFLHVDVGMWQVYQTYDSCGTKINHRLLRPQPCRSCFSRSGGVTG